MGKNRVGRYQAEFRRMVVERMKDCAHVCELGEEIGVSITRACITGSAARGGTTDRRYSKVSGALASQAGAGLAATAGVMKTLEVNVFTKAFQKEGRVISPVASKSHIAEIHCQLWSICLQ